MSKYSKKLPISLYLSIYKSSQFILDSCVLKPTESSPEKISKASAIIIKY
jgi:hypothetical protein